MSILGFRVGATMSILQRVERSEEKILDAMENNVVELLRNYAEGLKGQVTDNEEAFAISADIPSPVFNSITRLRLKPNSAGEKVERIQEGYESMNRRCMWWLTPQSQPKDIVSLMSNLGFRFQELSCMAINLTELVTISNPPEDLVIRHATTPENLDCFATAICRGLEAPEGYRAWHDAEMAVGYSAESPWQRFVGFINDKPVASSAVLMEGGVAGLYHVTVAPEARRRKIGSKMSTAALHHAQELGYRVGVLQATGLGEGVYRNLGFEEIGKMAIASR